MFAALRQRFLAHPAGRATRDSRPDGLRRPPRAAQTGRGRRRDGPGGIGAGHVFPHGRGARVHLGRCAAHRDRPGVGRGGEGAGRRRDPGSGREPETLPAVRAELRVLLGGPPAGGRTGRRPGRGHPVRRGRDLREAFRRQQPGNRSNAHKRADRRTHPEGNLPQHIRTNNRTGASGDVDVLVQPDK